MTAVKAHSALTNSNLLGNTGLDQEDAPAGRNTVVKPAGVETSIFEIPNTDASVREFGSLIPVQELQILPMSSKSVVTHNRVLVTTQRRSLLH